MRVGRHAKSHALEHDFSPSLSHSDSPPPMHISTGLGIPDEVQNTLKTIYMYNLYIIRYIESKHAFIGIS